MNGAAEIQAEPRARVSGLHWHRIRLLALTLIAFLVFSQTGLHPFREVQVTLQRSDGDLDKQIMLAGLGLLLMLGGWDGKRLLSNVSMPALLALLLAYCGLSISWALDPEIALRRFMLTAFTTWFIARAFNVLGYARTLDAMRYGLCLLLVLNYAAVILIPDAVHSFELGDDASIEGNWKGVFIHKNNAGAACALTILMCAYGWKSLGRNFSLIAVVGSAVFLYFSHSKTSEAALVLSIASGWAASHFGARTVSTRLLLMVMLVIGGLLTLLFYEQSLIDAIADPYGFTGRSAIWALLGEYARRHLWQGAGFGSFWQIGNRSPIWDLDNGWVAQLASSGHNGYLDLLVTIGLPGMLLAIFVLLVLPVYRLWSSPHMPAHKRGLLSALITFAVIHNLGESTLLERTSLIYIVLLFSVLAIQEERMGRASLLMRLRHWRKGPRAGLA